MKPYSSKSCQHTIHLEQVKARARDREGEWTQESDHKLLSSSNAFKSKSALKNWEKSLVEGS